MFDFSLSQIAVSVTTVLVAVYFFYAWSHSYWKRKNIPGPRPIPVFGNFKNIVFRNNSQVEEVLDWYKEWKYEPLVGLYIGSTPLLLVNDVEMIKTILIKDFSSFTDRGVIINEEADPLSAHLFALEGHRWRGLRSKLSPAFTSGKLKQMYYLLNECADHFEKYVAELVAKNEPIECRELTAKFTTDVIGSCAFGLDLKAMSNDGSEFRKMSRAIFQPTLRNTLAGLMMALCPSLFKFFNVRVTPKEVTNFFLDITSQTISYRKKCDIVRHDFVDLLIQIQAHPDQTDFELTDSLIAAQAFVFFLAGFETSSTTISYALYELAQNQRVQDKLRDEILDALNKHNGELPYETIKELGYLDKVMQETLRKHPPLGTLFRQSVKDFTIADGKIDLPKGTRIFIPVMGLHYDPDYYRNPEVFDPKNFDEAKIKRRPQMAYLPFGDGPRNCIGSRFATYQTKIGLIRILKNYRVDVCSKTTIPYVIDKASFILTPVGGIHLQFTKI
ncbi:probable cytochrome P450 6a14 [Athalia rosae]|uniref:probable cytochrome P450 6a14 n=1 Tax=Athalia rosae TaxID=37344 RepID=UPI0020348886|nr:probable cytochrome P450 6a14 [Athalia rosae]